jgi:hypothetical protein
VLIAALGGSITFQNTEVIGLTCINKRYNFGDGAHSMSGVA